MRQHRIKKSSFYFKTIGFKDQQIVFNVVSDEKKLILVKYGSELFQNFFYLFRIFREGYVACCSLFKGKTHPYYFGHVRVGTGRFGIEGYFFLLHQLVNRSEERR